MINAVRGANSAPAPPILLFRPDLIAFWFIAAQAGRRQVITSHWSQPKSHNDRGKCGPRVWHAIRITADPTGIDCKTHFSSNRPVQI
jgi:hypothetical protein